MNLLAPSQNEVYNQKIHYKNYTQEDYWRVNSLDFDYVTNEENFVNNIDDLIKIIRLAENDALWHEADFMLWLFIKRGIVVPEYLEIHAFEIVKRHKSILRVHEATEAIGMLPWSYAMNAYRKLLQMKHKPETFGNSDIYKTKEMQDTFNVALSNLRNTLSKYSSFQTDAITRYKETLLWNLNNWQPLTNNS